MTRAYLPPTVTDYGKLIDLTAATVFQGPEDGAMKIELILPHHSAPAVP